MNTYETLAKILDTATGEEIRKHLKDTVYVPEDGYVDEDEYERQDELALRLIGKYPDWELHQIPTRLLRGYNKHLAGWDEIKYKVAIYKELSSEAPPLVAVPIGKTFDVVDGKHRLLAAKKLGYKEVPCWVPAGTYQDQKTESDIDYRVEGPDRNDFDYRAFRDGVFPLQMGALDRYPTVASILGDEPIDIRK